ncbi:hypothetical protein [Endozoicomonas atrinae]|uniref:hypothetical protein n=1 Tax=Endozoicomonas atrinae TaxID=1333660 RepID=UPI003B00519E
MNKRMQKELNMLMRKNQGRCSICKQHYDDDEVVFVCSGYDKRHKLQTTTKCCHHKLVKILHLGLCGPVAPEDIDEVMKDHPLHDEFFVNRKSPVLEA